MPAADFKDVRQADAVLVLGEDLTNTAPLLALALRQLERPEGARRAARIQVPVWNDAGHREVVQQEKAPLYLATSCTTRLDPIAALVHHASPAGLAQLGWAVGHRLDRGDPRSFRPRRRDLGGGRTDRRRPVGRRTPGGDLRDELRQPGRDGGGCQHRLGASFRRGGRPRIVLTVPECNSMGLAMLQPVGGLEEALESVRENRRPRWWYWKTIFSGGQPADEARRLLEHAAGVRGDRPHPDRHR